MIAHGHDPLCREVCLDVFDDGLFDPYHVVENVVCGPHAGSGPVVEAVARPCGEISEKAVLLPFELRERTPNVGSHRVPLRRG